jgi:CspA family cold shock protein
MLEQLLEEKIMEGTVKWFNSKKGYGFIEGDDGEDYFVHESVLPPGAFLRENDRVSFEPAQTERGKQAQKVVLSK